MKKSYTFIVIIIVIFFTSLLCAQTEISRTASGKNGVVASGKAEGTSAGLRILEKGGTAADAAAASLLVLSIKHIGAFCIGGEVPIIIYDAKKKEVKVLSGQGAAPLDSAAIAWYYENGIPGDDIRAAAVPAVIDVIITALQLYGNMSFEQVAQPALEILDAGGPNWYKDTGSGDLIDGIGGKPINESLKNYDNGGRSWYKDLAHTFRRLIAAEQNSSGDRKQKLQAVSDLFYRGAIADDLVDWYIERGGFLRHEDLAQHVTRIEDPVVIDYRGYSVYKCDTWTQGPYLSQTLRLLEGYNLSKMNIHSADYIHLVIEAMKLALADRDEYYGDPLFADVPLKTLLSEEYTRMRRNLINMSQASTELRPGDPYKMKPLLEGGGRTFPMDGGTTTCVTADKWGNVVVTTPSGLSSLAGSGGHTGITHGTRLIINNTWKDHPNRIEPGKRPRTSLTPTLVMKDGKPFLAISVAGGDMQDQAALQLILDFVDFNMNVSEAMETPRFSTNHFIGSFGQDKPEFASIRLRENTDASVASDLADRGHKISYTRYNIGGIALIHFDPKSGEITATGSASAAAK